ncbi:hypothetical protein JCM10207_004291 [Rhodosporidiobolus poonsookiae]
MTSEFYILHGSLKDVTSAVGSIKYSQPSVTGDRPLRGYFRYDQREFCWEPRGADPVDFTPLSTTEGSPLHKLFHSNDEPLSDRFHEDARVIQAVRGGGSSFFNYLPILDEHDKLLMKRFPLFTGSLTLIVLLEEIFDAQRIDERGFHNPESVELAWLTIKILFTTRRHERSHRQHWLDKDFARGVFNKVNKDAFLHISRAMDRVQDDRHYAEKLTELEVRLLESTGLPIVAEPSPKLWLKLFQAVDKLLWNGQHHHTRQGDEPLPHARHIQAHQPTPFHPIAAVHASPYPPGAPYRGPNVGGASHRAFRDPERFGVQSAQTQAQAAGSPFDPAVAAQYGRPNVGGGARRHRTGRPPQETLRWGERRPEDP